MTQQLLFAMPRICKGQLKSEWIYEVIVSPKMQTKNTNKDHSTIFGDFLVSVEVDSFFDYNPCLFGRAELQFLVCILGEMMTS